MKNRAFISLSVCLLGLTSSASAWAAALNGSDDLFNVVQSILAGCAGTMGFGLSYEGGGSGVGAFQMINGTQEISPMSRPLESSEYCTNPTTSQGLLIGLDGVSILANQSNSCSSSTANTLGGASFLVTNDGTSTGGAPSSCPGCSGATDMYTLGDPAGTRYPNQPSFDALAVLYFGLMHDGTYDCANPVRKSLIRNWNNVFGVSCPAGNNTCTGGITHAWRLSDFSGSTDVLVSILNPPGKGIGTLSNAPIFPTKMSNPFCNSLDANTPAPGSTSFAGSSDYQDLDPVRTNCVAGKDGVCEGFKLGMTSGVFAGDLGVVQVVLLPDSPSTVASDLYPQVPCTQSCVFVAPIKGNQLPAGYRCPGGGLTIGGACFMPFAGTSASPDPRCVAASTAKCADVIGRPDGREYNLITVVARSQIPLAQQGTTAFQFALDANKRIMNGSYYRIHSTTAGANNVPDPTVGATGLCKQSDASSQIGCLVDSDPCSIGYAARSGARSFPGLGSSPPAPVTEPLKALAIQSSSLGPIAPFTPATVNPNPDFAILNLLTPGATPLYPFAHRLYTNTFAGFSSLNPADTALSACLGSNSLVGTALTSNNFVPIPISMGGIQTLPYPSGHAATPAPLPNLQGAPASGVDLPGCQ
jgi:hypothetical protein